MNDADIQSTSHTKQLISGLHRAKRVESTLSILLLVICMMKLGFSFSIVRLVGGYLLIVVSPDNLILFPRFSTFPSSDMYLPLFPSYVSPSFHSFPSHTTPINPIVKKHATRSTTKLLLVQSTNITSSSSKYYFLILDSQ
jgi:hypothetical protein